MKRFDPFPAIALLLSFLLLTYLAPAENTYGQLNRYWVALVEDNQIPDVDSDATGFVGFKFSDDYKQLIYNVNVHNIDNITGIYVYLKNDNQSTTPVLDLMKNIRESNREGYRWSDITDKGQNTGTLNLDGITKKDLTGPLEHESIKQLHKLMDDGKLYIVVHTKDHPNGELVGYSFVGMDDVFHDDKIKWN
jgi:CHRD domain-containing protein